MVNFIQCPQVLGVNGQYYINQNYVTGLNAGPNDPQTVSRQLATANIVIVNSFWLIPRVQNGHVIGYAQETAINTNVKPQVDAIKVLMIKDKQDQSEYLIAIGDNDNIATSSPPNIFAYDADGLGGSLPVMPTVVIPFPIIESKATSNNSGVNTFTFQFPANPLGLLYSIPSPSFNGAYASTAYAPSGITTPAQFVTWANTNWSTYGTWANPSGDIVTLASSTVISAGMIIALTPTAYCFNLSAFSTPATVNQLKFGTTGVLLDITPFTLTNNPSVLSNQLKNYMSSQSTTFGYAVANKLQVNTVYATPKLYNSGVLVVTSTAGVCS